MLVNVCTSLSLHNLWFLTSKLSLTFVFPYDNLHLIHLLLFLGLSSEWLLTDFLFPKYGIWLYAYYLCWKKHVYHEWSSQKCLNWELLNILEWPCCRIQGYDYLVFRPSFLTRLLNITGMTLLLEIFGHSEHPCICILLHQVYQKCGIWVYYSLLQKILLLTWRFIDDLGTFITAHCTPIWTVLENFYNCTSTWTVYTCTFIIAVYLKTWRCFTWTCCYEIKWYLVSYYIYMSTCKDPYPSVSANYISSMRLQLQLNCLRTLLYLMAASEQCIVLAPPISFRIIFIVNVL